MAAGPDAPKGAARAVRPHAEEAGIRLADKPAPLYELLVLATLLSARVSSEITVKAAPKLFAAGYATPTARQDASWQDRVDALGRGHYRRYPRANGHHARRRGRSGDQPLHGDLRKLRDEAAGESAKIASLLQEFPGSARRGPASSFGKFRPSGLRWLPTGRPDADGRPGDRPAGGRRVAARLAGSGVSTMIGAGFPQSAASAENQRRS